MKLKELEEFICWHQEQLHAVREANEADEPYHVGGNECPAWPCFVIMKRYDEFLKKVGIIRS